MRDLLALTLPAGAGLTRGQKIARARRDQQPKYRVRGELLTASEIAGRAGISYQAVIKRAQRGWDHDELDRPAGKRNRS